MWKLQQEKVNETWPAGASTELSQQSLGKSLKTNVHKSMYMLVLLWSLLQCMVPHNCLNYPDLEYEHLYLHF